MASLDLIFCDVVLGGLNHLLFARLALPFPFAFTAAVIRTRDQSDRPAKASTVTSEEDSAQGEGEWRAWT